MSASVNGANARTRFPVLIPRFVDVSATRKLDGNNLTTLPAGIFDDLGHLVSLSFKDNVNLHCLPWGSGRLTSLPNYGSGICDCPDEACDGCQPGKFGYTCDGVNRLNPCLDPQSKSYQCQSAKSDFSDCRIKDDDLEDLASCFKSGRGRIKEVSLYSNDLTTLPAELFDDLGALDKLTIHLNKPVTLPAGLFDELGSLTQMNFRAPSLTTLPAGFFDPLGQLTSLYMYSHGLTTIPEGVFGGLEALTYLYFDSNGLLSLPEGLFGGLGVLNKLVLGGKKITTLPAGIFGGLEALTFLSLSGLVGLQCLPMGSLPGTYPPRDFASSSGICDCPAEACDGCESGKHGYTCPTGDYHFPDAKDVPELSVKAFSLCCESSGVKPCPTRCSRPPAVGADQTSWYVYLSVLLAVGVGAFALAVCCFSSRRARGDGETQGPFMLFGRLKRLVVSKRPTRAV